MNEQVTLLDLAKQKDVDLAVGVIDNAEKFAPEITLLGRPVPGTSYDISVLEKRGRGGFRKANEGVETTKSQYSKKHVEAFIFDAQMEADKAVADAHPFGLGAYLAQEALNTTEGNFEVLGEQFYYGDVASSNGFAGLQKFTEANTALRVNANGDEADGCTSAYLIFNDLRGTHFVFGANGAIDTSDEWRIQKVVRDSKSLSAYVNGMTFWIGLQIAPVSVVRIANIDDDNPLTDKLVSAALEKFNLARQPNRLLMNRRARRLLQSSRSATTTNVRSGQKTATGAEVWAPMPTESNGIPIIATESIRDTEPVVSFS